MIAQLNKFQQNKRQDKSAMETSYTRLSWVVAHIHGAIFWNASVTMVYSEMEEGFSHPRTLLCDGYGETDLPSCQ